MNLENFHTFLNEPANLHRVNYNELKSLVAEYPYSANLRILLLLKSKLDKNPELGHHLKNAAAYSPNRSVLYTVMHDPKLMQAIREEVLVQEEVLELKDLSEVQSLLQREESEIVENTKRLERTIPISDIPEMNSGNSWSSNIFDDEPAPVAPNLSASVISIESLLSSVAEEEEPLDDIFEDREYIKGTEIYDEEKEELEHSLRLIQSFAAENISAFSKILDEIELLKNELPFEIEEPKVSKPQLYKPFEKIKPQPKNSFSSWLSQIENDFNRELEVPDINKNIDKLEAGRTKSKLDSESPVKPPKLKIESSEKSKESFKTKEFAKKSLSLNNEIVSETLAKLLVQQERYGKAIEMYGKLILKFPELEPMFSEEIERVKGLQ